MPKKPEAKAEVKAGAAGEPTELKVSLDVESLKVEDNKKAPMHPEPRPESDQDLYKRLLRELTIKDRHVLSHNGIMPDYFLKTLNLKHGEDSPDTKGVCAVTINGRKCFTVFKPVFIHDGSEPFCYMCEKPLVNKRTKTATWIGSKQSWLSGHPKYLWLCPECGFEHLHDDLDIQLIVDAKEATIDRSALAAARKLKQASLNPKKRGLY